MRAALQFTIEPTGEVLSFSPDVIVLAGYTGRDRAAVNAHIEELAALGVAPPPAVPAFYLAPPGLLTQEPTITAIHGRTCGEAEVAFLVGPQGIFLAPASDHTDREAERLDVQLSKLACPKVVGATAWRLVDVEGHMDEIRLQSFTGDAALAPYQDTTLSTFMRLRELLDLIPWVERPSSFVLFGGTVSAPGGLRFARTFRVAMHDPRTGRSLSMEYSTKVTPGLATVAQRPARPAKG